MPSTSPDFGARVAASSSPMPTLTVRCGRLIRMGDGFAVEVEPGGPLIVRDDGSPLDREQAEKVLDRLDNHMGRRD